MASEKKLHSGNLFFKHKFPSIDLEHSINYIDSFEEFERFYTDELIDGNVLLSEYLTELMRKYKTSSRELAEATGYHYDYIRKVKKGEKTNPERNMLLAICAQMRATVEETQILLRYAGEQPLYARRRSDAIIWYALSRKLGLQMLASHIEEVATHTKEECEAVKEEKNTLDKNYIKNLDRVSDYLDKVQRELVKISK